MLGVILGPDKGQMKVWNPKLAPANADQSEDSHCVLPSRPVAEIRSCQAHFEPLGFCLCAYMVVIFPASSLTDINKCVIKLSQCDTEVLPPSSWKSEGMFTLCSGAQSGVPEATGDLGWKAHMVQSHAGSPAWFLSVIATVPQISAKGRSPAERLLPLALCHKNAATQLWTLACLQPLRCSRTSAALLLMKKCKQSFAGSPTASPELGKVYWRASKLA